MKKIYKRKLKYILKTISKKFLKGVITFFLYLLIIIMSRETTLCRADVPQFSITNTFRAGNGEENIFKTTQKNNYLEEEVNFQVTWGNFFFGGRYEYDNPAEFGIDHDSLRKKFLEFRKGPWGIRAGTLNSLFSRGMVLNAYEEKPVGHDSEIFGVNAHYETEHLVVNLAGGSCDYEMIPDFKDIIEYTVKGGSFRFKIVESLYCGSSFVTSEISQKVGFYRTQETFNMNLGEIWAELLYDKLQLYANIASNAEKTCNMFIKGNSSIYIVANYFSGNTGINLEYKKYKFGLASPSERNFTLRHHRFLPYQNPPTVLKEHSWTLLSRRTHVVDFNDEVGLQLDIYHSLTPQTTLNVNGGMASRNYSYSFDPLYGDFSREEDHSAWLPSSGESFSPFWNIYSEIEHYFSSGTSIIYGISYLSEILYNGYYSDMTEKTKSFVIPIYINYKLSPVYSLQLISEIERFKESKHPGKHFYNQLYTMVFARSPSFSCSITGELLSKGVDLSDKTAWISGSIQYRFRSKQIFEVSYGEERGGLQCTNGLCRYVPPFKGWRFNITNQF